MSSQSVCATATLIMGHKCNCNLNDSGSLLILGLFFFSNYSNNICYCTFADVACVLRSLPVSSLVTERYKIGKKLHFIASDGICLYLKNGLTSVMIHLKI